LGVAFVLVIVLAAVAPDSRAVALLALVVVLAFLPWLGWAIVRFDKYVYPDPERQLRQQFARMVHIPSLRLSVLVSLPLAMGLPLAVIGAVAHVHGLVVAGLVILGVALVLSGVVLPGLSAWARRSLAKRRAT
jgi:hypothetical protein